jgi:hypothetical protein
MEVSYESPPSQNTGIFSLRLSKRPSNHSGTFDEYVYFGHRIFGFEIETAEDFQPPISNALISVQETSAAVRALAKETLNLGSRFITPAKIASVIDKSGSMIYSGYVDATRSNAQRLIDLMSLKDSAAVVSLNQTATTELPLTALTTPGDYADARSAVAGIAFGGTTSIGAGLLEAVKALAGASGVRSILLLSDGFENTNPMVSTILPLVPVGIPVHTIALGPASDQGLLQSIAAQTRGTYFFRPDELDLFLIYSLARTVVVDDDMVFEEAVPLESANAPRIFDCQVIVDDDADYVVFGAAVAGTAVCPELSLRLLNIPVSDLSRVQRRAGDGYQALYLRRPQPGIYELQVDLREAVSARFCSISAHVRSPVHLQVADPAGRVPPGKAIDLPLTILDHGNPLGGWALKSEVFSPATSVRQLAEEWKKLHVRLEHTGKWSLDPVPEHVVYAEAARERIRSRTGRDPWQYIPRKANLVRSNMPGDKPDGSAAPPITALRVPISMVDGTYNVKIAISGRTISGFPFTRVGFRSILAGA